VLDHLGSARPQQHDRDLAPVSMQTAILTLLALSVVGGLIVLTPLIRLEGHLAWWMVLVTVLLIVGAALAVRTAARDKDPAEVIVRERIPLFDNGFGADRAYLALVARPVLTLARLVVFLDREVVDAYVRAAAATAAMSGREGQRAHAAERAATGLVWVVTGVLAAALAGVAVW
jgi:NADH-quinone oxidoreductase subunit L